MNEQVKINNTNVTTTEILYNVVHNTSIRKMGNITTISYNSNMEIVSMKQLKDGD